MMKTKVHKGLACLMSLCMVVMLLPMTALAVVSKTVTGIAVKTQPSTLSYTEGDTLDLTGLVVTLTYNDDTTADVELSDFAANSITTSPSNGDALTIASNNGNAVTVSCNSQTADTNNLTVSAPEEISSASVTITAPVAGAKPETTEEVESRTNNTDFTVSNVVWNNALTTDGKFAAGTAYTATVTLTSKNKKTFASSVSTTVEGSASVGTATTTNTGVGNTVKFIVTYAKTAAKAVTEIAVKIQPSTLSYTEGDTLDLTGLVVTLTYNDDTTADVELSDFAANSITTSPSNGDALTVTSNNGNAVTVSCNSQTADTNNLTVSAALSNDATLSTLTYTVGKGNPVDVPNFSADTEEYNIELPYDTAANAVITLAGTANDTNASIITNGGVTLTNGDGKATITVTAQDSSTTKTYTLNFTTVAEPEAVTVTFNLNYEGAPEAPVAATASESGTITLPEAPTRTGYDFGGWFTSEDEGTTFTGDAISAETVFNADTTVYAKWIPADIADLAIAVDNKGTITGDTATTEGSTFSYYLVSESKQDVIDGWNVETDANGIQAALDVSTDGSKPTLTTENNGKYLVVVETKDGKVVAAGQSDAIDIDSPYTITSIGAEEAGGAGITRTIKTSGTDGHQYLVIQMTEGTGKDAHVYVVMVKAENSVTVSYKTTAVVQVWLTDGMPKLNGLEATGAAVYGTLTATTANAATAD